MADSSSMVNAMPAVNKIAPAALQNIGGAEASKGVLKDKNLATAPLLINVGEITKKLRSPKERKEGLSRLKDAIEKVLKADGAKLAGAHCEFDEKKLELAIVAGGEFAKITADWKSVRVLQNGETRDLGNFDLLQAQAFSKLITELAELNGVKVEFSAAAGAGAQ